MASRKRPYHFNVNQQQSSQYGPPQPCPYELPQDSNSSRQFSKRQQISQLHFRPSLVNAEPIKSLLNFAEDPIFQGHVQWIPGSRKNDFFTQDIHPSFQFEQSEALVDWKRKLLEYDPWWKTFEDPPLAEVPSNPWLTLDGLQSSPDYLFQFPTLTNSEDGNLDSRPGRLLGVEEAFPRSAELGRPNALRKDIVPLDQTSSESFWADLLPSNILHSKSSKKCRSQLYHQ